MSTRRMCEPSTANSAGGSPVSPSYDHQGSQLTTTVLKAPSCFSPSLNTPLSLQGPLELGRWLIQYSVFFGSHEGEGFKEIINSHDLSTVSSVNLSSYTCMCWIKRRPVLEGHLRHQGFFFFFLFPFSFCSKSTKLGDVSHAGQVL